MYNQLMHTYNWQLSDWPDFHYDVSPFYERLLAIAEKFGLSGGQMQHLAPDLQTEAIINFMVEEAIKTSEIEGEHVSRPDVRSSIKNQLGLNPKPATVLDKRAIGIAGLLIDVRNTIKEPLTAAKLFDWHLMLMSGVTNPVLKVGRWRVSDEPMQVVSGRNGKWIVHYEAPASKNVPKEMKQFIRWFNDTAPGKSKAIPFAPVRAAVAQLYFECIHPFDNGNGRIGRAIAEKALSQGFGYPLTLSLSLAIESDKKAYYAALKTASRTLEVTAWVGYFIDLVLRAQAVAENQINFILKKTRFFDTFNDRLNERQLKVIQRMLQAGTTGFEGGISARKYITLTGTSKATATRDLQHLHSIHALKQIGSGRSVRYELDL